MFPLHDSLADDVRAALNAYDDLTAALLARRGVVTEEDAERFLKPSYDLHLHDPLLMTDMPRAAERLITAITNGEKIVVWSDYDCDGIPGAVLFHDFLKKVGAHFENYIPHRHLEGYGVNIPGIEKLAKTGTRVIVTIDSGITDLEAVARAQELGIEVIVTDHHLPKETLPAAYAVVNPNARADEPYPFHALCGSAVAWKLICATLDLSPELRERVGGGWEKWLLDMVGLATIADMVPLIGENRVLATYGLVVMRKSPRLGLQKLCKVTRVNQRFISEDDVGFMLAPRVNAASRMGDALDAFHLLTTSDEAEAETLAKKLDAANRKRKAEAGAITRAVHERIRARTSLPSVIAIGDPEWRPALLGLVANSIVEEFERPVFLWGREGNESIKGSVRSGSVHALELMQAAVDTFAEFGGHAAAGGFTVLETAIFDLEDRLVEAHARIVENQSTLDDLSNHADALLDPSEIDLAMLKHLEKLAPYGMENPKPVFLIRDAMIEKIAPFGKANEHVKLTLARERGPLEAVTFFAKGVLAKSVSALNPGARAHLLAHIERDTFSRTNPVRLRLLNIKAA